MGIFEKIFGEDSELKKALKTLSSCKEEEEMSYEEEEPC